MFIGERNIVVEMKDEMGNIYGRLIVIARARNTYGGQAQWWCRCSCGEEKVISGEYLRNGDTKSCGCLASELISKRMSGQNNPSWKGGKTTNTQGYSLVLKPDHPNADKSGYVLEHVFIMSQHLGRAIEGDECVHHKNGIRKDNRIENLELLTRERHFSGQRVADLINSAIYVLAKYAPEKLSDVEPVAVIGGRYTYRGKEYK